MTCIVLNQLHYNVKSGHQQLIQLIHATWIQRRGACKWKRSRAMGIALRKAPTRVPVGDAFRSLEGPADGPNLSELADSCRTPASDRRSILDQLRHEAADIKLCRLTAGSQNAVGQSFLWPRPVPSPAKASSERAPSLWSRSPRARSQQGLCRCDTAQAGRT